MKHRRLPLLILAIIITVAGFSACTIRVQPLPGFEFVDSHPIFAEFHPVRTSYRIGERFELVARTTEPGYLTVIEYGPNNRANTIINQRYISSGRVIIPDSSDRFTLTVAPPVGSYRLVARFSPWSGGHDVVREARFNVY